MSATVPIVSELVVNGAVRATISDRSTISGAHPGGHYSVDMTRNSELSLGGLYTGLTTAKRTTTRRLCLVHTDNYHWRTPAPLAVAQEPAGSPNGIGVGFDKARMRINAMAKDVEAVVDEHMLVPKELFVGLVENTRDLIGSQQWRKGDTGSNDRQLDALEQEVARAKKLIQQQVKKPEHKPFKPAETYEALLAQARALDQLERNTRKMLQHYQQRDAEQEREKLLVSQEAMNSEQEANQRLTDEVERLGEELERLREACVPEVQRHQDEIDADSAANKWLHCVAESYTDRPGVHIEHYGLTYHGEQPTDGRVLNLWVGSKLAAQAVLIRDEANWTILTMFRAHSRPSTPTGYRV